MVAGHAIADSERLDDRVLVLAPIGRDAPLAATVLSQAGLVSEVCRDAAALCVECERGAGALLVTEEALEEESGRMLLGALADQPPWSDVPIVILTGTRHAASRGLEALRRFAPFGNVTLVERPINVLGLVSAVRVALRARRRQYELREHLAELARAGEALAQSEESYRLLAEAIPQMVWTARSDGSFDFFNRRWFEYTGRTHEQSEGAGWARALHPDDRDRAVERWRESVRHATVLELETRFYRAADAVYRWHLVRALPLRDGHGRVARWFGTCTDIDDRKRIEEALAAARADAVKANRAKDEFLAMLSHELRSPLSAIRTWAHLLRTGSLDPARTARAIETIERAAHAQAQIVEDLLDVSRIVSGKLRLELRPVLLRPIVDAAMEVVRPTAEAKGVILESRLEGVLGAVSGDPDRLQQVVGNLLSNAIKFTPAGGRVRVALEEDGVNARITVRDDGQGIPPAFLPYIFDRFRQANSAVTRSHGGLGLGLAIVRHLVEMHRGTVHAESAGEGQGAIFTITLALARGAEVEVAEGREGERAAALRPLLDGLDVLLVDDDALALESLSTALEQYGARVRTASSAADAIVALDRAAPDVLVSDIAMPGEDGYALIRRVRDRGLSQGAQVPAVALTAYAGTEHRFRALSAGFQAHIAKPFEPDRLAVILRNLVPESAARTA